MPKTITVVWRATRNTERGALRRHHHWHLIERRNGGKLLIQSADGSDLRWIEPEQVVGEPVHTL